MARSKRRTYRFSGGDGPPATLSQAVGNIILLHTAMEGLLFVFFHELLGLPDTARTYLFDSLHNRARVDLLQHLAEAGKLPLAQEEALSYALGCFDICAENRNIIGHASYEGPWRGRHVFWKQPTGAGGHDWWFEATLRQLRGCEADTLKAYLYLLSVWKVVSDYQQGFRRPLPRRPLVPRRLSSLRLESDPRDGPPPP